MAQLWDTQWRDSTLGTAGDWAISDTSDLYNSGGLEQGDPLATAIILALFSQARLPDYMVGRFGFTKADQHEWHGNTFGIEPGEEPLGSLLWTLRRAPLNDYTARLAEHYAADGMQTLVRNKWITGYTLAAQVDKALGKISLFIRTYSLEERQFYADLYATR